jgi:hypothetical protein
MSITPRYATIPDWCAISGMGRSNTYVEIGRRHIRAVKLGTRTLIDVEAGLAWLATLPPAEIMTGRRPRPRSSEPDAPQMTAAEIAVPRAPPPAEIRTGPHRRPRPPAAPPAPAE